MNCCRCKKPYISTGLKTCSSCLLKSKEDKQKYTQKKYDKSTENDPFRIYPYYNIYGYSPDNLADIIFARTGIKC
jgi:predicted amidophosphoribosyltransferase